MQLKDLHKKKLTRYKVQLQQQYESQLAAATSAYTQELSLVHVSNKIVAGSSPCCERHTPGYLFAANCRYPALLVVRSKLSCVRGSGSGAVADGRALFTVCVRTCAAGCAAVGRAVQQQRRGSQRLQRRPPNTSAGHQETPAVVQQCRNATKPWPAQRACQCIRGRGWQHGRSCSCSSANSASSAHRWQRNEEAPCWAYSSTHAGHQQRQEQWRRQQGGGSSRSRRPCCSACRFRASQ